MKEKVSPAIIATAIIVVLAIVAVIGIKIFATNEGGGNTAEMRKKYMPNGGSMTMSATQAANPKAPPPGAGGPGHSGGMMGGSGGSGGMMGGSGGAPMAPSGGTSSGGG